MSLLTLPPDSTVSINHDILGNDFPIQFSIRTPVTCAISIADRLADEKKLLTTKGRQLIITIEY